MDPMDYRIVWIHGIGQEVAGYSKPWEQAFNKYLNFPDNDYVEVLWNVVYNTLNEAIAPGASMADIPLTPQEQLSEAEVSKALTTMLLARMSSQAQADAATGEWSELTGAIGTEAAFLPDWILNPNPYIGEFVKYLVSRRIRTAVKERVKQKIRALANNGYSCSIIAHSWGTVVAYESLLDLEVELPGFQLANLFTLGSPLWLVAPFLDDHSGRKPHTVRRWVNIHAQGDLIGSWLKPGFEVDQDYAVPNFGNGDAHGSYFVPGNVQVQQDIVAADILG